MKIAFLGLGAMGSRMATRLIDAGHDVTVWNRSPDAAVPLADKGARIAGAPSAAARGAELVLSMVRDDAASRDVWLSDNGALAAMSDEAIGLECSTLSLPYVDELAAAFRSAGQPFLDAPLAGSRPQADAGQLIFLVGGLESVLETARPALDAMGGSIHHAGENGAGALTKLMVNTLFGTQLAVMGELIGLARRSGHAPARAVEAVGATPVASPAVRLAGAAMLGTEFPAAFPIDLVAKDFGLVAASAASLGAAMPLGEAAGAIYAAAVTEGYGADNITGIVQRYTP